MVEELPLTIEAEHEQALRRWPGTKKIQGVLDLTYFKAKTFSPEPKYVGRQLREPFLATLSKIAIKGREREESLH